MSPETQPKRPHQVASLLPTPHAQRMICVRGTALQELSSLWPTCLCLLSHPRSILLYTSVFRVYRAYSFQDKPWSPEATTNHEFELPGSRVLDCKCSIRALYRRILHERLAQGFRAQGYEVLGLGTKGLKFRRVLSMV